MVVLDRHGQEVAFVLQEEVDIFFSIREEDFFLHPAFTSG